MAQNQASHRPSLYPLFGTQAKGASVKAVDKLDIAGVTKLIERPPNGLRSVTDFNIIKGDEVNQVGTIGFSFMYGGLTYETRFMSHDGNHDIAEFRINIPAESLFLRPYVPVSRAEKIYMLSVIHHKADKTWLHKHLARLEPACFDQETEKPKIVIPQPIGSDTITPVKLFAHIGLNFPSDTDYKDQPDAALKAFEYWDAHSRYVMDVSGYPQINFYVSHPKISMLKSERMFRKMAEDMVGNIRIAAQHDNDIARYLRVTDFEFNLDLAIKRLPSIDNVLKGRSPV